MKTCNVCLKEKKRIDFAYLTFDFDILQNSPICKECYKKYLMLKEWDTITCNYDNLIETTFIKNLRSRMRDIEKTICLKVPVEKIRVVVDECKKQPSCVILDGELKDFIIEHDT